jgi:hypothetical protein
MVEFLVDVDPVFLAVDHRDAGEVRRVLRLRISRREARRPVWAVLPSLLLGLARLRRLCVTPGREILTSASVSSRGVFVWRIGAHDSETSLTVYRDRAFSTSACLNLIMRGLSRMNGTFRLAIQLSTVRWLTLRNSPNSSFVIGRKRRSSIARANSGSVSGRKLTLFLVVLVTDEDTTVLPFVSSLVRLAAENCLSHLIQAHFGKPFPASLGNRWRLPGSCAPSSRYAHACRIDSRNCHFWSGRIPDE